MLHIYGQQYWHCDARIVGTREDLARLRNQIADALKAPSVEQYFPSDGEGYSVQIAVLDEADMGKLPHTYSDECCGQWSLEELAALRSLDA